MLRTNKLVNGFAVSALATIIGLGLTGGIASAQTNYDNVYADSGAVVPIVIDKDLASNTAYAGQHFKAHLDPNQQSGKHYNLPSGTTIYGHVDQAVPKGDGQSAQLSLAFDHIKLPNGQTYPIDAMLNPKKTGDYVVQDDGTVVPGQAGQSNKAVKDTAIGAGAGVLGDLLLNHGKVNLSHVLIGGAAGYGVSTLNKSKNIGDVKIKKGTQIGLRLNRSIDLNNNG